MAGSDQHRPDFEIPILRPGSGWGSKPRVPGERGETPGFPGPGAQRKQPDLEFWDPRSKPITLGFSGLGGLGSDMACLGVVVQPTRSALGQPDAGVQLLPCFHPPERAARVLPREPCEASCGLRTIRNVTYVSAVPFDYPFPVLVSCLSFC
jgi:hypothetical protein